MATSKAASSTTAAAKSHCAFRAVVDRTREDAVIALNPWTDQSAEVEGVVAIKTIAFVREAVEADWITHISNGRDALWIPFEGLWSRVELLSTTCVTATSVQRVSLKMSSTGC
jgi:hypothetical protein